MAYLTESQIRGRVSKSADSIFGFKVHAAVQNALFDNFDIFLSHSVRDEQIVFGVKAVLERAGKRVYVDWIDDTELDRDNVTAGTAEKLRVRMRQCTSLFYLHTINSTKSRWMPWELGFFDAFNGNIAILPVIPEDGDLTFAREEYLLLYPKVDFTNIESTPSIFINRSSQLEVAQWLRYDDWVIGDDKLKPTPA